MRQKLQNIIEHLNQGLVGRDATIKAALLCALAGENIVLIGPPGTGKSMLARRIAQAFEDGDSYFEYLLTKFSTPEELFGPLSIKKLKEDQFERNTTSYLPSVQFAFLDEVFKASSSILNALLTIMNERIYHNGAQRQHVSLRSLIAASNEMPASQDELGALYDRFLMRCFVDYVSENKLHLLLAAPPASEVPVQDQCIEQAEIEQLQTAAQLVTLPAPIAQALQDIWLEHRQAFKEDRREQLSDRRLIKCLHLLRISATTNDRREVDLSDLLLLKDCLWNHPDNASKVRTLVLSVVQRHSYEMPCGQQFIANDDSAPFTNRQSYEIGRMNALIQGWCGSGTKHDPLLIQSIEDWMDLARPEVGMQGYHFRLTKNLDFSEFKKWIKIEFKGILDGSGFSLKYYNKEIKRRDFFAISLDIEKYYIIETTHTGTEISNLKTEGLSLINQAIDTTVHHCISDSNIFKIIKNCHVYSCVSKCYFCVDAEKSIIEYSAADSFFINGKSIESKFNNCSSGDYFFTGEFESSELKDCLIKIKSDPPLHSFALKSKIERCFIFSTELHLTSDMYNKYNVYSLNKRLSECLINNNLIGSFPLNHINHKPYSSMEKTEFHDNFAIELSKINIKGFNDSEFQIIPEQIFTQRFIHNNLKWDFENVWQWDEENNQPALRHIGINYQLPSNQTKKKQPSIGNSALSDSINESAITQQVHANIWL